MTDSFMNFLTSKEMMIVGCIALAGVILTVIVFIAEKTYYRRKRRHNTKELKNLVLEVKEESSIVPEQEVKKEVVPSIESEPILIPMEEYQKTKVEDLIEVIEPEAKIVNESTPATVTIEPEEEFVEELEYTNIEPNRDEAREELKRVTDDLLKKAETENVNNNIELTAFEAEQEKNAIISIEELMKKGGQLYEKNEVRQYEDEGNEPISIQDLELRMNNEPTKNVAVANIEVEEKQNTVKTSSVKDTGYRDVKFKSSPIISPIFGIESNNTNSDIELENTANFEKFDEEMRKTNEFIVTLKELQKKLD